MFLQKLNQFFHPEDVVDKSDIGVEGIINLMGEDDDKEEKIDLSKKDEKESDKEDKEPDEEEEKKDEEKDELDEIEEEPDEDKLELTTLPRKKDILKDFPELFKKYPALEKSYYRDRAYSELLPTIDDAKEAVAKAEILDKFEADIDKGDLTQALKAVKSSSEDAFNSLVDNYLPNLLKVDKDSYYHVVGNIIKTTVIDMINSSKELKDENASNDLKAAAEILNHYIFNTTRITQPSNLSKAESKDSKEADKIAERERAFTQRQFESARDDINSKVSNILKSTISEYIDPKESMTEYVRKNAIRECQEDLEKALESDTRLGRIIDKLWLDAAKNDFNRSSLDKIKSAYTSTARTVLPTLIKKARNEALKGMGKRVREEDDEAGQKKGPIPAGRSTSSNSGKGKSERDKAREIPKNMSSRDYIMAD